jgi:hypothetical protein
MNHDSLSHIIQWAGTIKPRTSEKQPCKVLGYPVYPALFMNVSAVVADAQATGTGPEAMASTIFHDEEL